MDRNAYIQECGTIQQDCIYTAEAHHYLAGKAKGAGVWYKVVPAIVAAASSGLAILHVWPEGLSLLAVVSATVSAVGNIIDPDKNFQVHLNAAKAFTLLKHDARALCSAYSTSLGDEAFGEAVKNLHNRYNDVVRSAPPTDSKSFEHARKVVKAGLHDPD